VQWVLALAALLDIYGEKRGNAQKAWADTRKRIDLVCKPLLAKPVAALAASDFQMVVDAYPSEATGSFVVRSIRPALKWAAQRGYVAEGLATIHPPAPVQRRKRILTRDELTTVLPALRASSRPYAAALRFMLLTLTRRQETALARWRARDPMGAIPTAFFVRVPPRAKCALTVARPITSGRIVEALDQISRRFLVESTSTTLRAEAFRMESLAAA
jgi:integrase